MGFRLVGSRGDQEPDNQAWDEADAGEMVQEKESLENLREDDRSELYTDDFSQERELEEKDW